jgi:RNA polymerase sigma-70 factor (ECF subfamily)
MLANRNEAGLGILYDNYGAAMYGVIYRIVGDHHQAEDLLQEAFVKIWNNFQQYDVARGRLFTWMINICRNLSIDKTRSKDFSNRKKNLSGDDIVSMMDSESSFSYNPDVIGIKEIAQRLDSEYLVIIEMLYFRGYTQAEAADELNIPLGTVKTRSRAAILKLKSILKEDTN